MRSTKSDDLSDPLLDETKSNNLSGDEEGDEEDGLPLTCLQQLCACVCCLLCTGLCTPLLALGCCCSLGNTVVHKVQGKRWDSSLGRWIVDDLVREEEEVLRGVPEDDGDILTLHPEDDDDEPCASSSHHRSTTSVVDTFYYDQLSVAVDADEHRIKRAYYVKARAFHPDRNDSPEAASRFQAIGEAYQVLSDDTLRAAYDKQGKDGLSGDKTALADTMDPALIFTFLFGSDAFATIVGRLQLVTKIMSEPTMMRTTMDESKHNNNNNPTITHEQVTQLEYRRIVRLALDLVLRIQSHVDGDVVHALQAWEEEAAVLVECRYGEEITNTVGASYRLVATQLAGSWSNKAKAYKGEQQIKIGAVQNLMAGAKDVHDTTLGHNKDEATGDDDDDDDKGAHNNTTDTLPTVLLLMWNMTVIDITTTLRSVVTKVVKDHSVDHQTQKKRAQAIVALGHVFEHRKATTKKDMDAGSLFQSAALDAMEQTLEKIRREEENAPLD